MHIYKILRPEEWAEFEAAGTTRGAPVDLADGYIHFSTAQQMRETAAKHFGNAGDLVLVAVDPAPLGDALRWEVSRGGAKFPHLYRALHLGDVVRTYPLPQSTGGHIFPEGVQ